MKSFKKVISVLLCLTMCISFAGCSNNKENTTDNNNSKDTKVTTTESADAEATQDTTSTEKFRIVASFYPMYVLTMNLVKGIDSVEATSMSEPNLGCIHDHTFSTEDLKKIEDADVYIENGLGLEAFNDKIKDAYPDTTIVEASKDVTDVAGDGDEKNAHVWTNIDSYIQQIQYVSSQLQTLNPENKDAYAANEKEYVDKLEQLKTDKSETIDALNGKKVLALDETLPNFCKFLNLTQYEIKTDHEQESVSADQLKDTISEMKKNDVKSILIIKDTDRKNAEAIANETGAKIYELNSCMVGEETEDAYLNDMKENLDIMKTIE